MDKWLKAPWFIRIVSLLLAVALYISVSLNDNEASGLEDTLFPSGSNDTVTMSNIPLQVRIDEEKYVVRGVPQTVSVAIEGSKSIVTTTERVRSFDVYLDLENLEPGKHDVRVQHEGFNNNLSVNIEPQTIEVVIEERATKEYTAEVDVINQNQLDDGMILGEPVIEPEKIKVTGGKSEIDQIAMVKAIVDLNEIDGDEINVDDAPVKVYDQQGNELNVYADPSALHVEIPVEVGQKEVPLSIQTEGELPDGLSLQSLSAEPEAVTVFGQESLLNSLEEISNLSVDLSSVKKDGKVEIPVPTPPGLTKVEPSTVQANIDVEETVEKTLEDIPIEVNGLEDGRDISFIEPENETIDITVFGTEKQLQEITAENFTASIDVQGFYEGEFDAEIQISNPEDYEFTSNFNHARVRIE
ncbi:YbbR domain-containing protein [Salinibacillus kushneri]|uniref:YbbR domain-containing protein n=1 Tax=Salinibacillus kushneri TaxID=237682 RepID=A0A1I0IKG6_9BACI|nr:CdaR family protein [Salinibacillus kushneri]SET96758.1 YbbR domain-containing protein [Salinibacillus kushneri]